MDNQVLTTTDKLAVFAGKLSAQTIRLLGAGMASNLPGRFARKVSPGILAGLSNQPRLGSLCVTGTNGKSTTTGLLSSILRTAGFTLVHNHQGANLVTGITASLVEASDWFGHIDADYGLFEIDEAALPIVAREVKLKSVLVTNLFRDQLDRFGELDTTARLISEGIKQNKSQAVLNADDPNVSQLVQEGERIFYGIENLLESEVNDEDLAELSYCSNCGAEISYLTKTYGQLGNWRCSSCDHKRPSLNISARDVRILPTTSTFTLVYKDQTVEAKLALPGLFNVYNAIAASAMALTMGVTIEAVQDGLKEYTTLFGRSERVMVEGKPVLIQLIKNPAGATQTIKAVTQDKSAKVLVAINDNLADGRDISWLWDADFEQFAALDTKFIVSGQRAEDMAVRLKYAGVSPEKIECVPNLQQALKDGLKMTEAGETLWLLPTYTCLLELYKILKKMGCKLHGT